MADKKTFTVGFDIADRFTSKYDEILKRINKLTDTVHKIELQLDSGSVSKIEASTSRVTRAVQKSTMEFGSQRRALNQAAAGFRNLADSMDRASGSQGRLAGLLGQLKGRFGELLNVADDFSDMTRSLAQGDFLGAGRAGSNLAKGGGRALAAGLGVSTGALLVGGAVAGAAALSLPVAATWEKQVGRASKTALGEGSSKRDLATDMLLAYQDLKGVTQEDFVAAVGGAGSLGYQDEEAVQAAVLGSKAGAAFEIETGEAMRMLGVVNQMWAEQAELVGGNIIMMEKAGSAVNVLGNKYSATEANVLQFLSEAGGLAKVWGMDVAETAAIGAVLETVNIKASEGETMFRSALNAGIFQKRALTDDQEKAFRKAGVRPRGEMGYDIAGAMLGVSGKEYQEKLNENMADTMFATVDAILEKAGGNDALAQQMAEAVFGSYGMGFLKLGGQRENLATMTEEAKTGFDAGKSLEEEYGRQTGNLIDTFDQTKKIFSSIAKVIGSLLIPPLTILLKVFNGLLGPVVKLAVFLEGMLFKQIEKIIGKFQGTQLGQDLAKAFTAITDAGAKIWSVIGPIMVKLLEGLLDILSGPVLGVLWLIAAIYDKIRPYVLKIVDALMVVVEKIKTLWTFIKDGLGITKGEKKEKFLKAAEGSGYKYVVNEKDKDEGTIYTGWKNEHGDKIPPSALPTNIRRAYEDYLKAPSSVFEQVGDYLTGILANVKELFDPVLNPLTTAIDSLVKWLESWFGGGEDDNTPAAPTTGTHPGGPSGDGLTAPETWDSPTPPIAPRTPPTPGSRPLEGTTELGGGYSYTPPNAAEAIMDGSGFSFGTGHAEGVTLLKDGIYTGKFHGPEEVLSREATIKGPGIIARAMEALELSTRSTAANQRSAVKQEVHIHNDNRFDFAGAKIDSAFDIAWFMREVDKRIEAGSKKAVELAIGQGRT